MERSLSTYSLEEREAIAKRARRSIASEVKAIMSAGFALFMVLTYFAGNYVIWPIVIASGISFIAIWIALSFCCAAIWAFVHSSIHKPRIASAAELDAAFKYHAQDKRRAETQTKIDAMKKENLK